MYKSRFHIAAMDCPSEEHLIRTVLASTTSILRLEFDVPARGLVVWHEGDSAPVVAKLDTLDLGARLVTSEEVGRDAVPETEERDQTSVLRLLLAINATMFVVEVVAGWLGESAGLLSDSLDMLADAIVYGIALWAVGKASSAQASAARVSGWFQLMLAVFVLAEVARRAIQGSVPEPPIMLGTAALALVANVVCLMALSRHRTGGVHMQASWIFSANDVIANLGVILAGVLVMLTSSRIPDLVIGAIIGLVVLRGAIRILRLARVSDQSDNQQEGSMSEANAWDRLAGKYDKTVKHFDRSYPRIREMARADLGGRTHVLEVAAGTGQFTFELADAAGRLTATDVSPEMVERLAAKLAERNLDNVTTAVMSAYDLDVQDGALDGIFCANALHVMETPNQALAEFRRALRPGGRLVIPTFCHGIDRRRRFLSWFLSRVSPFVAHTKFTPDSLKEMVAAAGFEASEPTLLPGKFPIAYLAADRP